jgi:hypothetical protein
MYLYQVEGMWCIWHFSDDALLLFLNNWETAQCFKDESYEHRPKMSNDPVMMSNDPVTGNVL